MTGNSLVYLSTSCIGSNDIVYAVRELSQITNNIELSRGGNFSRNLLTELINLKNEYGINFLLHSYFPPLREHFFLTFLKIVEKHENLSKIASNMQTHLK